MPPPPDNNRLFILSNSAQEEANFLRHLPDPKTGWPYPISILGREKTTLHLRHISITVLPLRECLDHCRFGAALHKAAAPQNGEFWTEGQQRLEKILLRPKSKIVQDGVARIVAGNENIVGVDDYSFCHPRDDLKIFADDIAADADDVTRIQK